METSTDIRFVPANESLTFAAFENNYLTGVKTFIGRLFSKKEHKMDCMPSSSLYSMY